MYRLHSLNRRIKYECGQAGLDIFDRIKKRFDFVKNRLQNLKQCLIGWLTNEKMTRLELQIKQMTNTYSSQISTLNSVFDEHSHCTRVLADLKEKLETLQINYQNDQFKTGLMDHRLGKITNEIEILSAKLKDQEVNSSLKEFINLKKELIALKEEKLGFSNSSVNSEPLPNRENQIPQTQNSHGVLLETTLNVMPNVKSFQNFFL